MHNRDRFDKFTEHARKVLQYAQEEAQRFQHNYIGTEHLLLGLVREPEGVAAKVLADLGIELDRVRQSVEFIIGRGDRVVLGEIGLTPRAKKVIQLAVDEARRLNHHYIGTEHLLLGLVREGEGIAAGVLASLGADLGKVRNATIQALGINPQEVEPIDTDVSPTTPSLLAFSISSRRVLTFAHGEALLFLHNSIDTEHILLGLTREPSLASDTLTNADLTLDRIHDTILQTIGQGDNTSTNPIRPDQDVVILLTSASKHTTSFQHSSVEPYHILLALLDEKPYTAHTILTTLGIDIPTLRTTLLQSIQNLP